MAFTLDPQTQKITFGVVSDGTHDAIARDIASEFGVSETFNDNFNIGTPDFEDSFVNDNWTDIGTGIAVNTGTQVIDWDAEPNQANNGTSFDLGAGNVSDTAWVLRYKMTVNNHSQGAQADAITIEVGLSDKDETASHSGTTQDFIGMRSLINSLNDEYNIVDTDDQLISATGADVAFTRTPIVETVYVEIKRTSATSYTISQFSDATYTTLLESQTGTCVATTQNLRYIRVLNKDDGAGTTDSVFDGTIDDVQFWNGSTTLTDWNNVGSQVAVNTSTERIDFSSNNALGENGSYVDLVSVSDTAWVLRFKFNFSSLTDGAPSANLYVGMSDNNVVMADTGAQDMIALNAIYHTASKNMFGEDVDNAQLGSGGGDIDLGITPVTGTDYYCELKRTSATTYELTVFSDRDYSVVIATGSGTCPATIVGLQYLKVAERSSGTADMIGTIDDIQFWNGITVPVITSNNWRMRFKLDLSNIDGGGTVIDKQLFFGLFDIDETNGSSTSTDGLILRLVADSSGSTFFGQSANGEVLDVFSTDFSFSTSPDTTTDFFFEIIRTNADDWEMSIYPDSTYTTPTETETSIGTATGTGSLRFIKAFNDESLTAPGEIDGTIDDITFTDLSGGVEKDKEFLVNALIQELGVNGSCFDVFTDDMSNSGNWTATDITPAGFFRISGGVIDFDAIAGAGDNDTIALDYQTLSGNTLSNSGGWGVRFTIDLTSYTNGTNADAIFSMSNVNQNDNQRDDPQDLIGFRLTSTASGSGPEMVGVYANTALTDSPTNLGTNVITVADSVKGFEIERLDSTTARVTAYTDATYSTVLATDTFTIPSTIVGLDFFKAGNGALAGTGNIQGDVNDLNVVDSVGTASGTVGCMKVDALIQQQGVGLCGISLAELKAYWDFDESSGVLINQAGAIGSTDSLGTSADGTVGVNIDRQQVGQVSDSYQFEGQAETQASNRIAIGSSVSQFNFMHGATSNDIHWTAIFWINPASSNFGDLMNNKNNSGSNTGTSISYRPTNVINVAVRGVAGAEIIDEDTTGTVPTSQFTMVTVRYDHSTGGCKVMFNNDFANEETLTNGVGSPTGNNANHPLNIATRADSQAGTTFDGLLDEWSIWDRILTDQEINIIYGENNNGQPLAQGDGSQCFSVDGVILLQEFTCGEKIIFQDDFSTSANWVQTGSQVTIASGEIQGWGADATDQRLTHDLVTPLNDKGWIAEFEFEFSAENNTAHDIFVVTDTNGTSSALQDHIVCRFGSSNLPRFALLHGANAQIGSGTADLTSASSGVRYFCRLERLSVASARLTIFTTGFDVTTFATIDVDLTLFGGPPTGLRFLQSQTSDLGGAGRTLTGIIDNLVITNACCNFAVDAFIQAQGANGFCGVSLANLKAYWEFDGASATLTNDAGTIGSVDSLGTSADGTDGGSVNKNITGQVGTSYRFNGPTGQAGNRVTIGSSTSQFNFMHTQGSVGTWNFWIFPEDITQVFGDILVNENNGGSNTGMSISLASGKISVRPRAPLTELLTPTQTTNALTQNVFTMVTVVWDEATGVDVYFNGVFEEHFNRTAGVASSGNANHPMTIGARTDPQTGLVLDGRLDEMTAWDRKLSASEISNLFTLNVAGNPIQEGGQNTCFFVDALIQSLGDNGSCTVANIVEGWEGFTDTTQNPVASYGTWGTAKFQDPTPNTPTTNVREVQSTVSFAGSKSYKIDWLVLRNTPTDNTFACSSLFLSNINKGKTTASARIRGENCRGGGGEADRGGMVGVVIRYNLTGGGDRAIGWRINSRGGSASSFFNDLADKPVTFRYSDSEQSTEFQPDLIINQFTSDGVFALWSKDLESEFNSGGFGLTYADDVDDYDIFFTVSGRTSQVQGSPISEHGGTMYVDSISLTGAGTIGNVACAQVDAKLIFIQDEEFLVDAFVQSLGDNGSCATNINYTNDMSSATGWVATDVSQMFVSGGVLNWIVLADTTNDTIAIDLSDPSRIGSTIDADFTLRFKVDWSTVSTANPFNHVFFGLSDSDETVNTGIGSEDYIGFHGRIGGIASPEFVRGLHKDSSATHNPTAMVELISTGLVRYYEIVRTGTSVTYNSYSDASFTTLVGSETDTVPVTVTGLRYFKVGNWAFGNTANIFSGDVDDLDITITGANVGNVACPTVDAGVKAFDTEKPFTVDGIAFVPPAKLFLVQGITLGTIDEEFFIDACLLSSPFTTFEIDACIQQNNNDGTFTVDGHVFILPVRNSLVDAIIRYAQGAQVGRFGAIPDLIIRVLRENGTLTGRGIVDEIVIITTAENFPFRGKTSRIKNWLNRLRLDNLIQEDGSDPDWFETIWSLV